MRHPFDATPDELAADLLDAFELEEVHAQHWLRVPSRMRAALAAVRRRAHKRLAFRRVYEHSYRVVLRHAVTGAVVRLPFA